MATGGDDIRVSLNTAMGDGHKKKKKKKEEIKHAATFYKNVEDKICEISDEEKKRYIQASMKNMPKDMQDRAAKSFQIEENAEKEIENIREKSFIENICGFIVKKTDDGDQSSVRGDEAKKLKYMWASGMDWNLFSPFASTWIKILGTGDLDAMLNYIKNKTDEEIGIQLELRETQLNFSALFHVCKGAMKNSVPPSSSADFKPRYVECLCKLLDLGANIHARDFAGFMPLHYCVTAQASPTSLKLAKILLKRGADPNAVTRLGCTPLAEPVMGMRPDCVKLLLDYGADPTIRDNDGCTVESQPQAQHRTMKPLFVEARKNRARQMRDKAKKELGGNLRMCVVCGENDTCRCTGCFLTRYCGRECQLADWDNHKDACKEVQSQYVPVKLTKPNDMVIVGGKTGKVKVISKDQKAAKLNFVVKIQIPFDDTSARTLQMMKDDEKVSLTLYDEKKTVVGEIKEDEPSYQNIVEKIRSEGVYGDKGFFYAILDKKNNLKINTTKILPPELW